MPIDPVCGMEVEEKEAAGSSTYKGVVYYFCSQHCKEEFDKDPEKYLKEKPEKTITDRSTTPVRAEETPEIKYSPKSGKKERI